MGLPIASLLTPELLARFADGAGTSGVAASALRAVEPLVVAYLDAGPRALLQAGADAPDQIASFVLTYAAESEPMRGALYAELARALASRDAFGELVTFAATEASSTLADPARTADLLAEDARGCLQLALRLHVRSARRLLRFARAHADVGLAAGDPLPLHLARTGRGVEWTSLWFLAVHLDLCETAILVYLQQRGPATTRELVEDLCVLSKNLAAQHGALVLGLTSRRESPRDTRLATDSEPDRAWDRALSAEIVRDLAAHLDVDAA